MFEKSVKESSALFEVKMADYGSPQAEAVRKLNYNIQKSNFMTLVFTELVPDAARTWREGEKYMGIGSPNLGNEFEPFVNTLLDIMSTTTKETAKQDVATFFEIAAVIFDHETMGCVGDSKALMNNIATKGYITELLSVTYSNQRMSPLVIEVTNLGIRTMGASLNIPADDTEVYRSLMANVAESVNETASETSVEARRQKLFEKIVLGLSAVAAAKLFF